MSKTLSEHNYHGIDATIIADSKNEHGQRITSFVCTFPRIVLAEFNTHRMLSRNSASSRAIPFKKMLKDIEEHPFIPIKWMKDHKGMQGEDYFTDETRFNGVENQYYVELLEDEWLGAKELAIKQAKRLSSLGLTKQIVNRLLEPFKWHTVIVTATEWQNFFALRAHEAAEIHIQDLAFKMLEEYNNSTPKQLKAGEWHIPFGDNLSDNKLDMWFKEPYSNEDVEQVKIKIAVARCARVSYENFDGSDDYEKDIKLHDDLISYPHASPFEHCARAMSEGEYYSNLRGEVNHAYVDKDAPDTVPMETAPAVIIDDFIDPNSNMFGWSGNFQGFIQYRKMIPNENQTDERVE